MEVNVTDSEDFWEWLRKRGEENNAQIEATLEIPLPSIKKPIEPTNNDLWTDVDFTIYEF